MRIFISAGALALLLTITNCGQGAAPIGGQLPAVAAPATSPSDEPPMVVTPDGAVVRPATSNYSGSSSGGGTPITYSGLSN